MQSVKLYTVDLTKTRSKGDFDCPRCGIGISPDDGSEDFYVILEPVMKGARLDSVILQCCNCRSQIHLTGFDALMRMR